MEQLSETVKIATGAEMGGNDNELILFVYDVNLTLKRHTWQPIVKILTEKKTDLRKDEKNFLIPGTNYFFTLVFENGVYPFQRYIEKHLGFNLIEVGDEN